MSRPCRDRLAALTWLSQVACSTPTEPVSQTSAPALLVDAASDDAAPAPLTVNAAADGGAERAATDAQSARPTRCIPVPEGVDIADHPQGVAAMGFAVAVLLPVEAPSTFRREMPEVGGVITGTRFRARVMDAAGPSGQRVPDEIEVQRWEWAQYGDRRVEIDPADGRPGRALARRGASTLGILAQSATYPGVWLLSRAWNVRDDGTTMGAALGQPEAAPAGEVVRAFRGTIRSVVTSDDGNSNVGGAR